MYDKKRLGQKDQKRNTPARVTHMDWWLHYESVLVGLRSQHTSIQGFLALTIRK